MVTMTNDHPKISYEMGKTGYGKVKVCCSTCVYDCAEFDEKGEVVMCKHKDANKKGFAEGGIDDCWSERKYGKK